MRARFLAPFLTVAGAAGVLVLGASVASAAPAAPIQFDLQQPDGTTVRAAAYGDEWSNGLETADGYTLVQGGSGAWEYAQSDPGGGLVPSGSWAGRDPVPPGLGLHLRGAEDAISRGAPAAGVTVEPPAQVPSHTADEPLLVILAQYTNEPATYTDIATWSSRFFNPAGDSVDHYYEEASSEAFSFIAATESHATGTGAAANDGVVGWLNIGPTHPNSATSGPFAATVNAAIVAADPFVDFAAYDTNSNGYISNRELHVTVVLAGIEGAYGGCSDNKVWAHQTQFADGTGPTVDTKKVGEVSNAGGYTIVGERHCDVLVTNERMATIGVIAHELGHDLGLPDLYDTSNPADSDGVGKWSLMSHGIWNFTAANKAGTSPAHFDAWSKLAFGWVTPYEVTSNDDDHLLTAQDPTTSVVQLLPNPGAPPVDWRFGAAGTGEYFLVENRQQTGYDSGLPGCGLLIWHVDETLPGNNFANREEEHRLLDLEEADDGPELETYGGDQGSASDPYKTGSPQFGPSTAPNSDYYSGADSNVVVSDFSACATTMNADFALNVPNDAFGSAKVIGANALPYTNGIFTGNATKQTNEPNPSCKPVTKTVWYKFIPGSDVEIVTDTNGSDAAYDTVLAVYQGTSLLGLDEIACNDNGGVGDRSRISGLSLSGGTTYYFQVGGVSGDTGALLFKVAQVATTTVGLTTPTSVTGPISASFSNLVGGVTTAKFRVRVTGTTTDLGVKTLVCTNLDAAVVNCNSPTVKKAVLTLSKPLTPGQHYTASVTSAVIDENGSPVTAKSKNFRAPVTVNESSPALTNTWQTVAAGGATGGSYTQDHWGGASASFTFNGDSITWTAVRGPSHGKARVRIDGVLRTADGAGSTTTDLYNASTQFGYQRTYSGLGAGSHTFVLEVLGTKRAAASGTFVTLDALRVGAGSVINTPAATYQWRIVNDNAAIGDKYAIADLDGQGMSITFHGTGVEVLFIKTPAGGLAEIFVDGTLIGHFNTEDASNSYNWILPLAGLTHGTHTVRLVSTGDALTLEGFTVTGP